MTFFYLKALHIIFVVTWFAGLFYIVRLFIYHTEASLEPEPKKSILIDQYKVMQRRLWFGITWPSAILTLVLGPSLMTYYLPLSENPWLITKLLFVFGLVVYHFLCHKIFKQLRNDQVKFSSTQLRIWNEVATIILFAVVFLVTLQSAINWIWGVVGIILFGVLLMLGIRLYKKIREKKSWEKAEKEVLEKQ